MASSLTEFPPTAAWKNVTAVPEAVPSFHMASAIHYFVHSVAVDKRAAGDFKSIGDGAFRLFSWGRVRYIHRPK